MRATASVTFLRKTARQKRLLTPSALSSSFLCPCAAGRAAPHTPGSSYVDDVLSGEVAGVRTLFQGALFEAFERPLPLVVDESLLESFQGYLNQTQVRGLHG